MSEKEAKNTRIAHLRALTNTNQCELNFFLEFSKDLQIKTDFSAVRQITDNVDSLLKHIQNKIIQLIKKAETKLEDIENLNIDVSLKNKNENIDGQTPCKDLFTNKDLTKLTFHIFEKIYEIIINAPTVQSVVLPPIIYAHCSVQPARYKALFTEWDKSEFEWFRSIDKEQWASVGNKFFYKTKKQDIDHYLKFRFVPKNKNKVGEPFDIISDKTVTFIPKVPTCPFEKRHRLTRKSLPKNEFRVVSYNILSDRYCDQERFPYCAPEFLSIEYRKMLIWKELSGFKADIICIQEMDNKVYSQYFAKQFAKIGYESFFYKKGNKIPEGLCCVFKKDKFRLLDSKHLVLSEEICKGNYKYLNDLIESNEDVKNTFVKQATSLQVTVLQLAKSSEIVVVANTHLYYHSEANHIRLIQVAMASRYLEQLVKKLEKRNKSKVSVIFCGDFNSSPTSGVYEFLTKGKLSSQHEDCMKKNGSSEVYQTFRFKSGCGTPKYTNYTVDFKSCLDYIFYETKNISCSQYVPFPTEEDLAQHVALPNQYFPSDHVSLIADFEFLE